MESESQNTSELLFWYYFNQGVQTAIKEWSKDIGQLKLATIN